MKKTVRLRRWCAMFLCCLSLAMLPSCQNELVQTVSFEETYLPKTEIGEETFYVGMPYEDFVLLFQDLDTNQDYVKYAGNFYFRTKDGMSWVVCFGEEPYQITRIERASITRLATREDFKNLPPVENYRLDYADILSCVGLPGYSLPASMMQLYYPLADGTWCCLFETGRYDFLTAEEVFGGK